MGHPEQAKRAEGPACPNHTPPARTTTKMGHPELLKMGHPEQAKPAEGPACPQIDPPPPAPKQNRARPRTPPRQPGPLPTARIIHGALPPPAVTLTPARGPQETTLLALLLSLWALHPLPAHTQPTPRHPLGNIQIAPKTHKLRTTSRKKRTRTHQETTP